MTLGPQFTSDDPGDYIPQEHHDWAWEITRMPDVDTELTPVSGEPYTSYGHMHFGKDGLPYMAPASCVGRHTCPPNTKQMRERLAFEKYRKASNL